VAGRASRPSIGHFQEPGLIECRGSLDIPVIGLRESVLNGIAVVAKAPPEAISDFLNSR
jgi:hypothetical protein